MNNAPILILNQNAKRQKGKPAQTGVISAAKEVSEIIRTTLGPRAMLKMLLDANNSAVLTNDGSSVLREIEMTHPAAKSIIELSRTQDERCGDGTTTVVVLAGELMEAARPFIMEGMHPARIVKAFRAAEQDCSNAFKTGATAIDKKDSKRVQRLAEVTLGTKFTARFGCLLPSLATKAVMAVTAIDPAADVKALVKVEKIPGGAIEESTVIEGIMLNKDILHPAMRRKIVNPKIILFLL